MGLRNGVYISLKEIIDMIFKNDLCCRIKQGAEEKKILMNRVKHLQQQNSRLIAQMNKLQALVFNTSGSKATPTTCLLIVLVSALLVSLPNLRVPQNSEWKDQQQSTARRALLSSQQGYYKVLLFLIDVNNNIL